MSQKASADLLAHLRQGKGVAVHRYGGQLRRLHEALCDPLQQETGIVFIGDSITWGALLAGNAPKSPRGHSLSDPRDFFETRSWVNEFKRAIGCDYFAGAPPLLSNWPTSPSGQSTAEYRHGVDLYPGLDPFASTATGACDVEFDGARLGYVYRMVDEAGSDCQALRFSFTGTTFTLIFTSIAENNPMNYELIVAGRSHGVFSTLDGSHGTRHGLSRTHTFAYVRRQEIEIRALRTDAAGVQHLELEAIRIDKRCVITNQGLIGTVAQSQLERHCGAGRPDALGDLDNFVFIQFGANDRQRIFSKYRQVDSVNNFSRNVRALVEKMRSHADIILMAAGPVADEAPPRYVFSMLDARNALDGIARRDGIDLIDHFAALRGMDLSDILADGLHPNELGHALMARNLLDALRGA